MMISIATMAMIMIDATTILKLKSQIDLLQGNNITVIEDGNK